MQNFPATPREIVASLWRNRSLVKASIKRDVVGRYRGSFMGILWSFFNPLVHVDCLHILLQRHLQGTLERRQ